MPIYLDTRGRSTLTIGICGRCSVKYPIDELTPDPNYPGLMVCPDGCKDNLDPYRLPAREVERVTAPFVRPDTSLAVQYSGAGNVTPTFALQQFGVMQINAARPWQPNTIYALGDSITPLNVDLDTTPLPQNWWVCIFQGTSGAVAPLWPTAPGVVLGRWVELLSDSPALLKLLSDSGLFLIEDTAPADGNVVWLNLGIYPN